MTFKVLYLNGVQGQDNRTKTIQFMGELFMKETLTAAILFIISIVAFILSIRSFREKGFLFNNAYLYASEQERNNMDKKSHYRQSAIVFLLIGVIFLLNAIEVLVNSGWIFYIVIAAIVITIIYAIASSIWIEKNK